MRKNAVLVMSLSLCLPAACSDGKGARDADADADVQPEPGADPDMIPDGADVPEQADPDAPDAEDAADAADTADAADADAVTPAHSCADPADHWIFCEDFDMSEPPAGFPECGGEAWHGLTPKSYDCEFGTESGFSTDVFHSGPRAYHQVRSAGDHGTMDLAYGFDPLEKVHLRMYVYFSGGYVDGEEELVHFLFYNTAVAGVNFGVDLYLYTDYQPDAWPPLCSGPGGLFYGFHSYYNTPDGSESEKGVGPEALGDCWNIGDHEDAWHSAEFMWDLASSNVKMWIDGRLRIDRQLYASNHDDIHTVIFSGWNSCASCVADAQDFYLDDIVLATDYIGPAPCPDGAAIGAACLCGGSPSPDDPSNVYTEGYCCAGAWSPEPC